MSSTIPTKLVPVWAWVVVWLALLPVLIAPQIPTYARIVAFVLAAGLTIGLIFRPYGSK